MAAGEASWVDGEVEDSSIHNSKQPVTTVPLALLAVALLLALTGFTFASSTIVSVVALPFLVLFAPVILPAALAVAAAVVALGACGVVVLCGLRALRWGVGRVKGRVVGWSVTAAGHEVRVQEREVGGGCRQREVQVKGA